MITPEETFEQLWSRQKPNIPVVTALHRIKSVLGHEPSYEEAIDYILTHDVSALLKEGFEREVQIALSEIKEAHN